jgi:hypothetical protein
MRHALLLLPAFLAALAAKGQTPTLAPPLGLTGLKAEAVALVEADFKRTQEIVDSLFSFSELGFQEFVDYPQLEKPRDSAAPR